MIRPKLTRSERPYAEALKKCFAENARKAVAFTEPSDATVFFANKADADAFENRLYQIEGDHLSNELIEEKVSQKGGVQDRRRREIVHFGVFHGTKVPEGGEKPPFEYEGPFAVRLQFTNPRIGWHVWMALHNPKNTHPLVERAFPMMEIFDETRANLPHVYSLLEGLRGGHALLLQLKQDLREYLASRRDALAFGKLSNKAELLEKNLQAFEKKRLKFLAGTSATHLATAAMLALSVKTFGFLAALGYQWTLGGLSIKHALDFSDRENQLLKKGLKPHHFAELELHRALGPGGLLATQKPSARGQVIGSILDVLDGHIRLHQQYIDYLDRELAHIETRPKG